jgi:ABC-type transport system involved in multi-copper enzyme maturation permease subunit
MAHNPTHPTGYDTTADKAGTMVRNAAKAVGAVFLLVGILGFVPGITTNIYPIAFAGHEDNAHLLGLFEVSILHNLVHLLFGVAGLAMAKTAGAATNYLIGGGVIYIVLAIFGAVIDQDSAINFVPLNFHDNWLHLVLGIGMIALGTIGLRARPGRAGAGAPR